MSRQTAYVKVVHQSRRWPALIRFSYAPLKENIVCRQIATAVMHPAETSFAQLDAGIEFGLLYTQRGAASVLMRGAAS